MREIVTLKLDVEGMKHQMVHAFSQHSLEIEQQIKEVCDRYLASGELFLAVEREFHKAVSEAIRNYFAYGDGARMVKEVVEKTVGARR
jgi:hypothetical protein